MKISPLSYIHIISFSLYNRLMRLEGSRRLRFECIAGEKCIVDAMCLNCRMMKPVSEFEILRQHTHRWGIAWHCNACKLDKETRYRKQKRLEIIEKLGGKCCLCYATTNLQLHHIVPRRKHAYLMSKPDFVPESLKEVVCLCYDCHLHKAHEKGYAGYTVYGGFPDDAPRLILND